MRLNYGPFEPQESNVATQKTRLQFLWNAKARIPAITADLYENCYPLYEKFLASNSGSQQEKPATLAGESISYAPGWRELKSSEDGTELLSRLDDWSARHGLFAEWCQQFAVRAMKAWVSDEEALHSLSWCKEPAIVRYILFPQFYPEVQFSYEHLRTLRWAVEQLGVVNFGPDEEPYVSEASAEPEPPGGFPRLVIYCYVEGRVFARGRNRSSRSN